MMNRIVYLKTTVRILAIVFCAAGIVSQAQERQKKAESRIEPQIGILIEHFELDHRTANQLMRENMAKASDAQGLRNTLDEMLEKGNSTLVETTWFRAMSGNRTKAESIRETISPTEYDPPSITRSLGVVSISKKEGPEEKTSVQDQTPLAAAESSPRSSEILMTSATPTAFETRNVGTTVEADTVFSDDRELVEISISPEIVSFEGRSFYIRPDSENIPWGVDHVSMALFYTMRTSLQLKALPGHYNLLGMFTPPDKPDKKIISLLKVDLVFAN